MVKAWKELLEERIRLTEIPIPNFQELEQEVATERDTKATTAVEQMEAFVKDQKIAIFLRENKELIADNKTVRKEIKISAVHPTPTEVMEALMVALTEKGYSVTIDEIASGYPSAYEITINPP